MPEPDRGFALHGSLATRYRGRVSDGRHDQDVYETAAIDAGEVRRDGWSAHVLAQGLLDLDGSSDPSSPYFGNADTTGGALDTRLFQAYVDVALSDELSLARFGRQDEWRTPVYVAWDGARLASRELGPLRVVVGAYGGLPAPLSIGDHHDGSIAGAYVELDPWTGGHARADFQRIASDERFADETNELLGASISQRVGQRTRVEGAWTGLDGRNRDVTLRTTYSDPKSDVVARASFHRLLETQNDLALEIDPFTDVLLAEFPYSQVSAALSKGFGQHFSADVGVDVRRVSDRADVGEFNRDFDRTYATLTFSDVASTGVAVALTGEVWNGGGDHVSTWGVDFSRRLSKPLRASIGSFYSLYRYDSFLVEERDDVRTYYAEIGSRGASAWSWSARYEHEDSVDAFDTLRLGVTWRF